MSSQVNRSGIGDGRVCLVLLRGGDIHGRGVTERVLVEVPERRKDQGRGDEGPMSGSRRC